MDNIAAVILAAGKGTRMLPLTLEVPKPMLRTGGKNLIEWKLDALPDTVSEVVLVVGYLGDVIRSYFGDERKGKRISYAIQTDLSGTAGALVAAKDLLPERFMVMMGDDLYDARDLASLASHRYAIVGVPVENEEIGGEIVLDGEGRFLAMREERHFAKRALVNAGLYMLDRRIFDYPPQPIGGSSTEFGLPHTLALLARDYPVDVLSATRWMQISAPSDLEAAKSFLETRRTD